ncbi:invasion associated locus B family protein [Harenicola maris]
MLLLAASPALAQETGTATEEPAATGEATASEAQTDEAVSADGNEPGELGLSMGTPADGSETGQPQIGQQYVAEEVGDWEIRCVRTETGKDPCQLYQLLVDDNGNSVAEFSLFNLRDGGQAVAGATIITPLETLLTQQITLSVDAGAGRKYPFTFCAAVGCFARVGFAESDVAGFRNGNQATVQIVPAGAPDQKVDLTLSLTGFTAGYANLTERNAAAAAE